MTLHRGLYFVVVGLLWGGFAFLLGSRAFGAGLWTGLLVSPAIGLLIGWLTQKAFERHVGIRRALIALGSVYLGATLFGIAIGLGAFAFGPAGGPNLGARVTEGAVTVWWGVTMTGFLLFLWPLAYATHWFLEWRAST